MCKEDTAEVQFPQIPPPSLRTSTTLHQSPKATTMSNVVNCTEQQPANIDAKGVSRVVQNSRFLTLPAEIRTMIYDYHFTLPRPIRPMLLARDSAFFRNHESNCPLNDHRLDWDLGPVSSVARAHAICRSPFGTTDDIPIPPSVLDLLLVCHDITDEAKGRFYKVNHFVFENSASLSHLKLFIESIGERYLSLKELSFRFNSKYAGKVFGLLSKSINLKAMHIVIDPDASGIRYKRDQSYPSLDRMVGMDALLKIRGLETLDISVQGRFWRPRNPAPNIAIKRLLRSKLLLPHPDAPASQGSRERRAMAANATNASRDASDTTTQS